MNNVKQGDKEKHLARIMRLLKIAREMRDWDWFERLSKEYERVMMEGLKT